MKRVAAVVLLLALLGTAACGDPVVVISEVENISHAPKAPPPWAKVAPEQIAEAKKHGVPVAFENDLGMRFVLIPAGTFLMGSPEARAVEADGPQHRVTLSRPFYLATTPTTQAAWESVMADNPSVHKGESLPVTNVSWKDCQSFVMRVNETDPVDGYRLPTEAEWEWACRAGARTPYWSGDAEQDLARVGWYEGNSEDRLQPAGSKPASPWGLHDMHGGVWEWCQDGYRTYGAAAASDPQIESPGERVNRGGSWTSGAVCARSDFRSRVYPEYRYRNLGVRLVKALATE